MPAVFVDLSNKAVSPVKRGLLLSAALRRLLRLVLCLALMGVAMSALGVERFPPPEFEPGYKIPVATFPTPRALWLEWMDVAVLFATLCLSTWFVMKKRSRKWILNLGIFSLLYFGFYRKGCVCAIGSIQDVTMAVFNNGYSAPLSVAAFFLLPIVFALFCGRSFCGSVCPQGAIQDLVLIKPVKIWPWLEQALRMGPFIYLGAAVLFAATGAAFIICEWDPFVAMFRLTGRSTMMCVAAVFLVVGMFVGRPYCRFLCPYGAILSTVSRFSKWKVTLTPNDCIQCALCEMACPYGAISEPAQDDPNPRARKLRLAVAVVLLPILVATGFGLGGGLAVPFSKIHPVVRTAEWVASGNPAKDKNIADEIDAFKGTGRPVAELNAQALKIRADFVRGGKLFGAFLGLVFGLRLISLAMERAASIYEPDAADCVSCGRCYNYCPKELARVKKLAKKPDPNPSAVPIAPTTPSAPSSPAKPA